ncbi:Fungal specific transcription factor domain-containing protein [Cladophialophora immunda]|nr:Fungal specific transcription factor domain-containing protein [Cladophialophora immunda]
MALHDSERVVRVGGLSPSFFEGKQHGPRSPICDAIIDFGDVNGASAEGIDVAVANNIAGDGSFDIFGLSAQAVFSVPAATDIPNSLDKAVMIDDEPEFQADFLAPYPSPTHTILADHYHPSSLPKYITPLKKTLSTEDLHHLQIKGAFDIPDLATRDLLLTNYAKWIHPFAPMLDLEEILSAVSSSGNTGTTSLLLFQAVMFAATAYVNIDGHDGRHKKTRGMFYERARLLHDFDVEADRLIICQAAILLSFWDGDSEGVRDSYYWVGIATLHATTIGLSFDPASSSLSDQKHRRSFKMTWWTLVMRDRLLAVALRRPVQNKAFRFDVPMLHLDDFRLESLLEALQNSLEIHDVGLAELETLASSCMALAQLSEYIDKVLTVQYTVQRTPSAAGQSAITVSLVPRINASRCLDIMMCGQELQNWYGYLPTEVQQLELESHDIERRNENPIVRVHKALLAGYYSMTLMTLYRPLLNLSSSNAKETKLRILSMKMVSQAAKSITSIFTNLYADHLISWLPDTAIAVLEPAVATHLLYSMSELDVVRQTSFQKFYLCWRILQQLGEVYYLAETTMSMLNAAAQRLKSLPDLKVVKSAACSQLIDAICPPSDDNATSHVAVPFVGVVGEQKRDRSDVAMGWDEPEKIREEPRQQTQVLDTYDHNFDLEANCALDPNAFDQLVCWDVVEEELRAND